MSDELRKVKVDTVALTQQVSSLVKERDNLARILEDIKKKNNILKESWETRTSESVFTNFNDMYVGFQQLIDNLNADIKFLNNTISKYNEYEEQANNEIDKNITS